MAWITTKGYIAARQMKKHGNCISENELRCAVSVCVTGGVVKTVNNNSCLFAIGRSITDLRREVGLTQGELAEKADISVVHLSNIELGKKTMGLQKSRNGKAV